ncbi:hypothetical protein D3C84_1265260 [compost metagenome]
MAGRLVEADAVVGLLAHHQEAAVALDDGGDCGIRFPLRAAHRGFAFLLIDNRYHCLLVL